MELIGLVGLGMTIFAIIALVKGKAKLWKFEIKEKKMAVIVLVIGLFITGIVGAITETNSASKEEKDESAVVDSEEDDGEDEPIEEEEPEPETLDSYVKRVISDTIGDETNRSSYPERIKDTNIGDGNVVLHLISNDNLSRNAIKGGIKIDSERLFPELFANEDVDLVDLVWYAPLTDQYGNEELREVLNINMWRETYEKINWDNFLRSNFENVADSYWEHTAFSN
ncbi:hypothetical protein PRVXH_000292 [Proteinivorax hydrogeniformans]|uniref:Uncharacterized protein n=1 Tax=Proteinivorax hydrogeniformans TaxID=1826727 RepID=A0AAU8HUD5_9FIRM